MTSCPYCGFQTETVWQEVAHMNEAHRELVVDRLRAAGLSDDEIEGVLRTSTPAVSDRRELAWVTRLLDQAGVPARSYEAQGGGMCDWTLAGRVDHLLRLLKTHGIDVAEGVRA